MRLFILLFAFILSTFLVNAQQAPNFTFTDVDGNTHNLHVDYLDKGKIVVSKVFFVFCPPCNAAAPGFQAKYVQYGSGSNDVQFIALSNKTGDDDNQVIGFKNQHGITFPIASATGGSVAAQATYTGGLFGGFFGTPHYTVFAPDKTVYYDVSQSQIDQVITDIRNNMNGSPGTPVTIQAANNKPIPSGVQVYMKPANQSSPVLNITSLTNGTYQFEYPSADFPEMTDPIIYIESTDIAQDGSIRVGDLIPIRKHILGLEPFTTPQQEIISDVNGDGNIRASDLVVIRKVILGLETTFEGVPSYVLFGGEVPLDVNNQSSVTMDLEILKIGNHVD